MKKLFFTMLVLCSAVVAKADNESLTAILQHGETASVFKGSTAFKEAAAAADDGDVITLSAGSFVGDCNIMKSVSIYGAGFEEDAEAGTEVTQIAGPLYVGPSLDDDNAISNIHFEGVYITQGLNLGKIRSGNVRAVSNVTISKCKIDGTISLSSEEMEQVNIDNTVIAQVESSNGKVVKNIYIRNSYISNKVYGFSVESQGLIDHCILGGYYSRDDADAQFRFTNCIFVSTASYSNSNYPIYHNSIGSNLDHCIYNLKRIGGYYGIALRTANTVVKDCVEVSYDEVFADATDAKYSSTRTFELKKPKEWIGTDGTEIGIRGGEGWNKVPRTPVVKNLQLNVDGKTLKVSYDAAVR